MGNFLLRGLDQHAWSKENETDLIAIRRRESGEPFSRWLINTVVPYFHSRIGKRLKVRISAGYLFLNRELSSILRNHTQRNLNPKLRNIQIVVS
jgi:hypothetical protein